jgi:Tol biopolymer transport system component
MPLTTGTRLGPYEVLSPLGAGGMGEVYRARDTRLGRDVAIKILHSDLTADAEVRNRFEREARTISGLNHPNICTLFDIGREGDTAYVVMELVEGETLAQRLSGGPLPAAEVLRIGAQIADALELAHRAGAVHRDLKPGNVMLTRSGAKLMDFGLARPALVAGSPGGAMTQSPTIAQPLTAQGTIVGTFQYMAPELLAGREADARADLWALGCVLYEMATGKSAFEGKSQAHLIAAIMNQDPPPMAQLAPMTPPTLDQLVRGLLAKDPEDRIQTAHDVRLQLQWIAEGGSKAGVPAPVAARRQMSERIGWGLAALLLLVAAGLGWQMLAHQPPTASAMRVTILPPENANIDEDEASTQISPDGKSIVFVATDSSGATQLWRRDLADPRARPLAGTGQAALPFWSPDSRSIGFFADGKLKKVDAGGRNVETLCDAPDGNHFLYVSLAGAESLGTRLGSLDSGKSKWLLNSDGVAIYAAPGHLLFGRNNSLMVQPFDPGSGRLTGDPQIMGAAPGVSAYTGSPAASVSANGVIAQRHSARPGSVLTWLDRAGHSLGNVPAPPGFYFSTSLSPDQRTVAAMLQREDVGSDIRTIDLESGRTNRLSDLPFAENPVWSPDGKSIAFSALTNRVRNIYRVPAGGSAGDPELYVAGQTVFLDPVAWTPQGDYFIYRDLDPQTGEDVWAVHESGDRKPYPLLHSRWHEIDSQLSPDGHWISYRSNESGRAELYIASFPSLDTRARVSTDGAGSGPRSESGRGYWRKDGREIVWVGSDGLTVMSASVETAGGLHVGTPHRLCTLPQGAISLTPAADHQRFLVLEPRNTKERSSIQLTLDWPAELKSP